MVPERAIGKRRKGRDLVPCTFLESTSFLLLKKFASTTPAQFLRHGSK